MSSRTSSAFGTLGDRIAQTPATGHDPAAGASVAASVDADGAEPDAPPVAPVAGEAVVDGQGERREVETCHVWVDGTHAGILTSWWRPVDVWFGEVAWTPPDQPGAVALEWIEASRLRRQG